MAEGTVGEGPLLREETRTGAQESQAPRGSSIVKPPTPLHSLVRP